MFNNIFFHNINIKSLHVVTTVKLHDKRGFLIKFSGKEEFTFLTNSPE